MNYIYGTWSALCALNAAGVDPAGADGAQGASTGSAASRTRTAAGARTAPATSSTIAAMSPRRARLADRLGAARADGGGRGRSIRRSTRGVAYLASDADDDGLWTEERFTATGFPRVFYLRYHGYAKFFPLWALARYRRLEARQQPHRRLRDVRSQHGPARAQPPTLPILMRDRIGEGDAAGAMGRGSSAIAVRRRTQRLRQRSRRTLRRTGCRACSQLRHRRRARPELAAGRRGRRRPSVVADGNALAGAYGASPTRSPRRSRGGVRGQARRSCGVDGRS